MSSHPEPTWPFTISHQEPHKGIMSRWRENSHLVGRGGGIRRGHMEEVAFAMGVGGFEG